MYFFLSSLFSFVTTPLFYIVCFVILGFFLRPKRWKRICYGVAIGLALLFTDAPLYQYATEKWYGEYDRPLKEGKRYAYGIVLGGYSNWDWERNRVEFSGIADRLLEGIRLYKHGRIGKLVLASDGSIIETGDMKGNPVGMMGFLKDMGMPPEDVVLEAKARNTQENAQLTLELIGDSLKTEPVLLITSAIHMRRSLLAFRAAGMNPDAYVTDTFLHPEGAKPNFCPSLAVMVMWHELLHEWIGYIVYNVVKQS